MKTWQKEGKSVHHLIESFTIGKDRELDVALAPYDSIGSMAHAIMLAETGLIGHDEKDMLLKELARIYRGSQEDSFRIEEGIEDVHSQIELELTNHLGDVGKKIHTGRSRNDQILVDLKLFSRDHLRTIVEKTEILFYQLIRLSEHYRHVLLPGYTHFQVAMPSSFGLWFAGYAESLVDDLQFIHAAYEISNQNPLGSGAGYGTSFPLKRRITTNLLGFRDLDYNVMHAQMGRGKLERSVIFALSSIGSTLAKMAMDVCMFMSQNFGFVSFPEEFTTGSSIMPHKKNPDVFELIRAKGNRLKSLPGQCDMMMSNLPSGYHRDFQLLKEVFLPSFDETIACLDMTYLMMNHIRIHENNLEDDKYSYLFTVEEVNKKVMQGQPFRDAYQEVARQIEEGTYVPDKDIQHSLEGSMGNLCNPEIMEKWQRVKKQFDFERPKKAFDYLLRNI